MKEEGQIITVFPTTILSNKINREFTKDELICILDYFDELNSKTEDITTTDMYILDNERLSDIKSFCQEILNDYFLKVYDPINPNDVKLKITQSWLNFTSNGKYHEKHKHYNSFMSGIIYINAYKDKDSIIFSKADTEFNWQIQCKESNPYNASHFHYSVNTGDILIFPSNLYHSTPINNNNYVRISLAFSSFIDGVIGYVEGPLKQINQLNIKL